MGKQNFDIKRQIAIMEKFQIQFVFFYALLGKTQTKKSAFFYVLYIYY